MNGFIGTTQIHTPIGAMQIGEAFHTHAFGGIIECYGTVEVCRVHMELDDDERMVDFTATLSVKFQTEDGIKSLQELETGDMLFVRSEKTGQPYESVLRKLSIEKCGEERIYNLMHKGENLWVEGLMVQS